MTIRNRAIYAPSGPLAIVPQAYGMAYDVALALDGKPVSAISTAGDIAIVSVHGPLMQHPDGCFRSYNEIRCDVETVLQARPKAVVLAISSPGGLVSGCFELADMLRAMAAAAGVPLIAYVDGQACSAAYALACAATRIVAPATADVGSIGVISILADATRQAEAMGMRFAVIASGKRKADGNPMTELTAEVISAKQAHVDELAEMFFAHVAQARGVSEGAVRALEAGTFTGTKAQRLHLVDEVQNLDQLLASLNQPAGASQATAAEEDKPMSVKATLQAVIDDDKASDEDKDDAKKALAALDDSDDKAADGDDSDDDKPKDDDKAAADDSDNDKPAKDDAKAGKGPFGVAASADVPVSRAEFTALQARLDAGVEQGKRNKILATRPDLTKAQRKTLAEVPTAALAATLGLIPVAVPAKEGLTAKALAAVQTAPGATPTAKTGEGPKFDDKRQAQRKRMGLAVASDADPIRVEGDKFIFSVAALAQSKSGKAVAQ